MSDNIRRLYIGDNIKVMRRLADESVDLIYLDPPFNSKKIRKGTLDTPTGRQSFSDIWTMRDIHHDDIWRLKMQLPTAYNLVNAMSAFHGKSWKPFCTFMAVRLIEMRRILKRTGSIYLHCDQHMHAPLRLLMDAIFGEKNFRNEIVWAYNRFSRRGDAYPSMNDSILFYGKSRGITFNKLETAPRDTSRYERGYHTVVDQKVRRLLVYDEKKAADKIAEAEKKGIAIVYTTAQNPSLGNVWTDIPILNPMAKERTGWATQKPPALLERVITASSNKGDIVLDPFCGCGTACISAQRLGRQWIGIDKDPEAENIMRGWMAKDTKLAPEWDGVQIFDARKKSGLPKERVVDEINKKDKVLKASFYKAQDGKCKSGGWCKTVRGGELPIATLDWDRKIPAADGGYYTYDNVQLLCRACNGSKGKKGWTEFIR